MATIDIAVSVGLFGMILGAYAYVHGCHNSSRNELDAHKMLTNGQLDDLSRQLQDFRLDVVNRLARIETKMEDGIRATKSE